MKVPRAPHVWRLNPRAAMAVQRRLAGQVLLAAPDGPLRLVAGLDAAFSSDGRDCIAGVVLWDQANGCVIEEHVARKRVLFPYVPGLLSFREAPALLGALRKLRQTPDVLMCDGQGLAHPRRFGIACHLGVICDLPSIGCAKSRLIGRHGELAKPRGACTPLHDGAEIVGTVVRTREGTRPLFVSVGHRMTLPDARQLVLDCAVRFRLPEPTRLADRLVAMARRRFTERD